MSESGRAPVTNEHKAPIAPGVSAPVGGVILRGFAGWRPRNLGPDIVSGLTLAAIAIPEQMATARLAGFPPQAGFVALIAGAAGFALFGASRRLSVGADSTIAPIFAGTLAAVGATDPARYADLAGALAVLVGLILIVGGLLRFGFIADLLSIPVTIGFLAGIAAHIVLSQAPDALGLQRPSGPLIAQAAALAGGLESANLWALGVSLGVLAVVAFGDAISARIPAALIGVAAAAALSIRFGLEAKGVAPIGVISLGGLGFTAPSVTYDDFRTIAPLAIIVTMVAMVQTAATTRSFPDLREGPDIDRDFLGVGVANALSGFMGAFPLDASPPRTAVIAETGGTSQAAGLVAAALAVALLLFGGQALAHVPRAALAGVLFFIAARIVRVRVMLDVWRRSRAEFLLILTTGLAMLVLPIEQGVTFGIIASLLHGVWTTTRTQVVELARIKGTSVWWPQDHDVAQESVTGVRVLSLQAPLAFLNAYGFRDSIRRKIEVGPTPRLVVIEANALVEIDYTGATVLADLVATLRAHAIVVALARLESVRAQESFERQGLMDLIGRDHIFPSVQQAIDALLTAPDRR